MIGVRGFVAAAVLVAHLLALVVLKSCVGGSSHNGVERDKGFFVTGITINLAHADVVPLPEVVLQSIPLDFSGIQEVRFDDVDQADISGVIGAVSAPRLARLQSVELANFARQAGLLPGQVATVILVVQVLEDGSVGAVNIVSGNAKPAVEAAAVDYVRSLRWIPGTRNHRGELMRVRFPVTLVYHR